MAAAGHPSPTKGTYLEGYHDEPRSTGQAPGQSALFFWPLRQNPPHSSLQNFADAPLGRSHRAAVGKAKLKAAIDGTRDILGVPDDYRIGIVPASDTGAVEMAMWSLLGARKTTIGCMGKLWRGLGHRCRETVETGLPR